MRVPGGATRPFARADLSRIGQRVRVVYRELEGGAGILDDLYVEIRDQESRGRCRWESRDCGGEERKPRQEERREMHVVVFGVMVCKFVVVGAEMVATAMLYTIDVL